MSVSEPVVDQNNLGVAEAYTFAMSRYREWFGPEPDPDWQTTIIAWQTDKVIRNVPLREYSLSIRKSYTSLEQRIAATAHETYHRVTMTRPLCRAAPWLDESLAFLASQRVLREMGEEDYADLRTQGALWPPAAEQFRVMTAFRRRPFPWSLRGYPPQFSAVVRGFGLLLERDIAWDKICRLPETTGLEAWREMLDGDERRFVSGLVSQVGVGARVFPGE